MKFDIVFVSYSLGMGFVAGVISALFLVLVNFCLHFIWVSLPNALNGLSYYPILVGVIGGLGVGLVQKYLGPYPRTMHETLTEYKKTKKVKYKNTLGKNFFSAVLVLGFGASLGPEAALSSILGGLMTWIGDHLKLILAKKEELLSMSIGAMLSAVFHAPFVGVVEPLEEKSSQENKFKKIILYGLTTLFGLFGFRLINSLFPEEPVLGIHLPKIVWEKEVFLFIIPAFAIGLLFGALFLLLEKWSNTLAKKINSPVLLALLAGLVMGLFSMISPYFLFSGETALFPLSKNYLSYSIPFLIFLAVGKAFLTNLNFAFGWRGGKIFPVIFASATVGFAFVSLFPYTPGLLVSIISAVSVTVVLGQPLIVAALLLFLVPLPFFPVVLGSCFLANKVVSEIRQKISK